MSFTDFPTGFQELDAITNGMNKGELIILAARPSIGITSFALNIAYNVANNKNRPVLFFSLDTSKSRIVERLYAYQSNINCDSIRNNILTKEQRAKLKEVENEVTSIPIYIDEDIRPGLSIDDIVLKSKKLKDSKGYIGLIVIDYIDLIDDPKNVFKDNEQARIAYFSRRIKKCAMDLECPILCLVRLSKRVEFRDDKKPQIADLDGAIEQYADKVLLMYRPAYYEEQGISLSSKKDKKFSKDGENAKQHAPVQQQPKAQNESQADVVEILIAKNKKRSYWKYFSIFL